MAAPKRTVIQKERDRHKIAGLYCRGWTQQIIADYLNESDDREHTLSRRMISYDIQSIIKAWRDSSLIDINSLKAAELLRINNLEQTYWDAWERSCEDEETKRLEGTLAPGEEKGKTTKQVVTRKGQAGDPRFLTGIQWCIERRCKILGIDAPAKQEHGGLGGGPIKVEVGDVNDTRKRLLASVQRTLVSDEQSPEEEVD